MSEKSPNLENNGDTLAPPPINERLFSLLELDDDAFEIGADEFLNDRLDELSEVATSERYDAFSGNFKGFMGPDSEIFPQALGIGYKLDDPEPYRLAIGELRRFYRSYTRKKMMEPEKALLNASLMAAQYAEVKYFGNISASPQEAGAREYLLADIVDDSTPSYRSIAEFKGKAMCAERAYVCNNILQMLGVDCSVENGWLKIGDEPEGLHAWLFVKASDDTVRIFDPQNPIRMINQDGGILGVSFTAYPADTLADPNNTEVTQLEVFHENIQIDEQGAQVAKLTPSPYVYRLSNKDFAKV